MNTRIAEATNTGFAWLTGELSTIVAAVGIVLVVLIVAAVFSAFVDSDTSAGGKLLWVLLILWVPLLGAVSWFVVGKKGHLNRFLGIDRGRARHTIPVSVGQHSNVASRKNSRLHPA